MLYRLFFQAIGHLLQKDVLENQNLGEPGGASWVTLTAVRKLVSHRQRVAAAAAWNLKKLMRELTDKHRKALLFLPELFRFTLQCA
ncbi:MAG TPA: hypothetical protein IAB96_01550 [Candidatus Coprenecus pullicola]|nr:hypothetical protein [Candidatus Coprenecus pullicola]